MLLRLSFFWAVISLFSLTLSGCGGGSDEVTVEEVQATLTLQTLVNQTVNEGETVTITASGKIQGASAQLNYDWTVVGVNDADISGLGSSSISFVAPFVDEDRFIAVFVTLSAEGFLPENLLAGNPRSSASVTILDTTPRPPVANAGPDQEVPSAASVTLNGNNSTDNRGITSYTWVQTQGDSVGLNDANSVAPTFTATNVNTISNLRFELTVTDEGGLSDTDSISVRILPPEPPTATISNNQFSFVEGETVTLDGSLSSDELGIDSYQWTQISGPSITMSNTDSAAASFIAPDTDNDFVAEFLLTVTDLTGLEDSESISITIRPINQLPIAEITGPSVSDEELLVALDGSGSNDPDGEIVSFQWSQISGESVVISDSNTLNPSFTAPTITVQTTLVFQLEIEDNRGAIVSDEISITVNPVNLPPTLIVNVQASLFSRESGQIEAIADDLDGAIVSIDFEQLNGSPLTLIGGSTKQFTAPLVDQTETISFLVTATDNEGAEATETISFDIQRPNDLTEIFFPIEGSLYEGDEIAVQGRTTEGDAGTSADITVSIAGNNYDTTTDAQGYWRVENVQLASNSENHTFQVDADHGSGAMSSAAVTIVSKQVPISDAIAVAQYCGNNQLFILLEQQIVEMDCSGNEREVIASDSIGTGEAMPHANFIDFVHLPFSTLVIDSSDGLIGINVRSRERSIIYPKNGEPPLDVQLLSVDSSYDFAYIKDGNAIDDSELIVEINLETGARRVLFVVNQTITDLGIGSSIAAIDTNLFRSELFIATYSGAAYQIDIETGDYVQLADGSEFGTFIEDIVYRNFFQIYLVDANSTALYNVSGLAFNPRLVTISGDTYIGPGYRNVVSYPGDSRLFALVRNESNSIVRISIPDGSDIANVSVITEDAGINARHLGTLIDSAYDKNTGRVFVSGSDAISFIDIDIGVAVNFLDHADLQLRFFNEKLAYDPLNNALFVSGKSAVNSAIPHLAQIDGLTGSIIEQPKPLSTGGLNIVNLTVDSFAGQSLFVGMGDEAFSESYYRVDIPMVVSTGNSISASPVFGIDLNHLPNADTTGIESSTSLYAVQKFEQALVEINPGLETSNLVVDFNVIGGGNIFPDELTWSEEDSLVYLSSSGTPKAIFSLDPLAPGFTEIASETEGRGPNIETGRSIHNDDRRKLLIYSESGRIFVIDKESGDRVLVYTN